MSRFILDLAHSKDDLRLQEIVRNNYMEGKIKLLFERYPSFFQGVEILGDNNEVMVARDKNNSNVVALAIRSLRNAYVNGNKKRIGYLSGLRIEPNYRNGTILGRGYNFLRQLNENNPVPFYLISITEDNAVAFKTIASQNRPIVPMSRDMGQYCTLIYRTNKNFSKTSSVGLEIKHGQEEYLPEIIKFINGINAKKQFAPYYSEKDFLCQPLFRGVKLNDFFLAFRKGRLVGIMAKWDQRSFKQIRIAGYDWKLNFLRPGVNIIAKAKGLPYLPRSGKTLNYFYASFLAVSSDGPGVFINLLESLRSANLERDCSLVMLGIHSNDPLLKAARHFPHLQYNSRLWMMYWPEQRKEAEMVDCEIIPFVDLATL